MDRAAYMLLKRRLHVARQRAIATQDPQAWREYEKAKAKRDRAYFFALVNEIRDIGLSGGIDDVVSAGS
jgi:hypothetical protein